MKIFSSPIEGVGKLHIMKGSKQLEIVLHFGQDVLDLNYPCIKSTMILWFLFK